MSENIAAGVQEASQASKAASSASDEKMSASVNRRLLLERWKAKNNRVTKSQQTPIRSLADKRRPGAQTALRGGAQRVPLRGAAQSVSVYCTPAGRVPISRTRTLCSSSPIALTPAARVPLDKADDDADDASLATRLNFSTNSTTTTTTTTTATQNRHQKRFLTPATRVARTRQPTASVKKAERHSKQMLVHKQQQTPQTQKQLREKLAAWRMKKDAAKQQRTAARRAKQFTSRSPRRLHAAPVASNSLKLRLTSALSAAHRATLGGKESRARSIYRQIPRDRRRFEGVRLQAAYWTSYALFEEYHGHYIASLQLYEEALQAGAEPRREIESNLVCFMLRTEEKTDKVLSDEVDDVPESEIEELLNFMSYVDSKEEEPPKAGDVVPETPALPPKAMMAQNLLSLMETREGDRPDGDDLVLKLEFEEQEKEKADETARDEKAKVEEKSTEEFVPRRSHRLAEVARQKELAAQRKIANEKAGYVPWWLRDEADEQTGMAVVVQKKANNINNRFKVGQAVSVRVSRRVEGYVGGWIDAEVIKQTSSGVRVSVRGETLMLRSAEVQLARGNDARENEWVEGTQVHVHNAVYDASIGDIWWEATIHSTTAEFAETAVIRWAYPAIDESPTRTVETRYLRLAE